MNCYQSIFLRSLQRLFLLNTYAVFFVVQFFFSFKSESHISYSASTYSTVQNSTQKKFVVTKDRPCRNPGFRLNKRFQPAIVPSMFTPSEDIPVIYLDKDKTDKPVDYFLISFILAKSLRGPPTSQLTHTS